ncbi:MAG: tetratricopeptide repeat protein [Pirellulales bacterium]
MVDQTEKNAEEVEEVSEYEVSPALRKRLQQVFDHAQQLIKQPKYDFDYAHSLLGECAKKDPNNLIYVETMFTNLEAKFDGKKPSSMFGFGGGGRGIKKLAAAEKWDEVLDQGIDQLKNDPWEVTVLRAIIDACQANRYNETGLCYLKNEIVGGPNDIEVWRHAARFLGKVGQFNQAISFWHNVDDKNRGDVEANKMMSQLTLDKERQHQGLSTITNQVELRPGEKPPVKPESKEEPKDEGPKKVIELSDKQLLEKIVDESPEREDNYWKLVDLWVLDHKYHEADLVIKKAAAVIGNTPQLIEKQEAVRIARAKHRYLVADKQAKAEETDEARKLADDTKSELYRTELEIYGKRAERFPEDITIRYEYGVRLKRVGNLEEAIATFDEVIEADKKLAPIAMLAKGESLQATKRYKTALECYRNALSLSGIMSSDHQKMLLYRTGVLALALTNLPVAEETLGRLIKLDPNYRDIQSRVDKLNKMREDN